MKERTKIIDIDSHLFHEKVLSSYLVTSYLASSKDQFADIFPLQGPGIKFLCSKPGAYDLYYAPAWGVLKKKDYCIVVYGLRWGFEPFIWAYVFGPLPIVLFVLVHIPLTYME